MDRATAILAASILTPGTRFAHQRPGANPCGGSLCGSYSALGVETNGVHLVDDGQHQQTLVGDGFIYRLSKSCLNMAVNILANQLRSSAATCVLFHLGWVRTDLGGPSAAIDPTVSVGGMMNAIKRLKP